MRKPIIGVTVGTPISSKRVEKDIKPVKTINNVNPDENGNVELAPNNIGASPTGHKHTKSEITGFPTTETWTFTLEDGSVVKKAVYAENAQKTITMSVISNSGGPCADVTCNGQTYYGATSCNANIGDVLTVSIQGYEGITLTVNGVVVKETFDMGTYDYEHIVTGNTLIENGFMDADGRAYVNITYE